MNLKNAITEWYSLAAQEDRAAELGITHPSTAEARAECYRRTARALEYQLETGVAVCSCHMKPLDEGCGA